MRGVEECKRSWAGGARGALCKRPWPRGGSGEHLDGGWRKLKGLPAQVEVEVWEVVEEQEELWGLAG